MGGFGQGDGALLSVSAKIKRRFEEANGSLLGDAVRPDEVELLLTRERGPEACHTACALELLDPLVGLCLRLKVTLLASAVDKDTDPPTGLASVVTKLGC